MNKIKIINQKVLLVIIFFSPNLTQSEGVDLPALDMVLFLRPTESPTVFMQQLGRGLRCDTNKKYLNILDFIGNYKNASLIPAFLASAVSSYDRRLSISVTTLREILPDECFVDFDLRVIDIFERMQKEQMALEEKIAAEYYRVKEYLGERPLRLSMYTYIDDDIYAAMRKKSKINIFNDYLLFLKKTDEILPDEEVLIGTKAHEFLRDIETMKMTKLYKMPVLLSFLQGDKLLSSAGEKEIAGSFRSFYSHKENAVDLLKDKSTRDYSGWGDKDYFRLAERNPIHFLCQSSKGFFSFRDGRLYLSDDLAGFLGDKVFVKHFKDVVEYRTRRFYKERLEGD